MGMEVVDVVMEVVDVVIMWLYCCDQWSGYGLLNIVLLSQMCTTVNIVPLLLNVPPLPLPLHSPSLHSPSFPPFSSPLTPPVLWPFVVLGSEMTPARPSVPGTP